MFVRSLRQLATRVHHACAVRRRKMGGAHLSTSTVPLLETAAHVPKPAPKLPKQETITQIPTGLMIFGMFSIIYGPGYAMAALIPHFKPADDNTEDD